MARSFLFFRSCPWGILMASIILCSCLRYVPSRDEIAGTDAAQFAGPDAFFSLEKNQKRRISQLIAQRSAGGSASADTSYRVGVGDVLQFEVFDVPELNRKVRVRPTGDIALPLVGTIKVADRTESEIQQDVETRLTKFVREPQVQLFISEYQARKVWVTGAIHKPGSYPLIRGDYSLNELLAEAGGRTDSAGSLLVLIPQAGNTGASKSTAPPESRASLSPNPAANGIEIYFDDLVGSVEKRPLVVPLLAGDTIVVPEAGMVQIDGEVGKPGSYQVTSRMTLLGAIASASGLTYSADVAQVEVIRELGSGKKALITVNVETLALKQGNDIRLRSGDVVRVPSAPGRFTTRQTINVINGFLGRLMPSF